MPLIPLIHCDHIWALHNLFKAENVNLEQCQFLGNFSKCGYFRVAVSFGGTVTFGIYGREKNKRYFQVAVTLVGGGGGRYFRNSTVINLVPRAFSLTMFKMAARREKALAKADKISKNLGDFYHVTF